jgi:hypothetical protein
MDDYFIVEIIGVDGEWHPLYNRFCGIATFPTEEVAIPEARAAAKEVGRVARVIRFTRSVVYKTEEKPSLEKLDRELFG